MSFLRHQEIFPSDEGATHSGYALAHRLDEFPAGYSSAGCAPAGPASASPARYEYALQSSCRSRIFHPTANSVLTVCLSSGGHRKQSLAVPHRRLQPAEHAVVRRAVVQQRRRAYGGQITSTRETGFFTPDPVAVRASPPKIIRWISAYSPILRVLVRHPG